LAVVEPALGVRPILYTGPVFWQRNLSADFGAYPLWIAEYGVDAPRVPPGWERWHLWQWRGDVALPEIAAVVDLNRLHPDVALDELRIPAER
jgi:lysozyme